MMSEASQKAEQAVIEQHLRHLTRRWGELDRPCVFELRLLTRDDAATVKDVTRYRPDGMGIEMAAEHAAAMNAYNLNSYVVVNPIDAAAQIETGKGAKDEHIVASFFHWADGDDQQAADNIKSFVGPKPTWHVLTGSQPCFRPHVYWELEDPTYNLDAWNRTQKAIAANLRTDNTVVNPSRIMRLAGTVNWPKPKKLAKGYVAELTTLHIHSEDDRPRVTSERMARAFAVATPEPTSGLQIATNVYDGPTSETYADMLRRARTDGEKHGGVRDLAASLAGQGIKRELAEAIVRDACPVWDEGVERLLDTAYEKFAPVDAPAVQFDHAPAPTGSPEAAGWQLQSARDFTADFVAPEYLIEGVVQRGRLYTLTAPTGSGKTAIMLHVAACMSLGQPVCERETEPGDVIYMAGENPDDVRARVIATTEAQGIDIDACNLHFIAGTFSIRQDIARVTEMANALPNVTLIVVDTLAAYFDGDDSNSNAQMLDFARVLRALTIIRTKPAVIVPAHPVKNALKTNLTPMGGSALLNEVDGNLCLWKRETAVEMHWQGKHRGAEFDPLMFELKGLESDRVRDSKGRKMPTVMAIPLLETRAMQIASEAATAEDRLLININACPAQSVRQRAVEIGLVNPAGKANKAKVQRMLQSFREQKLASDLRGHWELTPTGEKALEIVKSGGTLVDPDA